MFKRSAPKQQHVDSPVGLARAAYGFGNRRAVGLSWPNPRPGSGFQGCDDLSRDLGVQVAAFGCAFGCHGGFSFRARLHRAHATDARLAKTGVANVGAQRREGDHPACTKGKVGDTRRCGLRLHPHRREGECPLESLRRLCGRNGAGLGGANGRRRGGCEARFRAQPETCLHALERGREHYRMAGTTGPACETRSAR